MILQYAEKMFYRNFTDPGHKFLLSLHYNGENSYLFVNGKQELKFKAKTNQIIQKNLCLGNLSHDWTKNESTKTSIYRNTYDFVVDYKPIIGVDPIYDMHRYLEAIEDRQKEYRKEYRKNMSDEQKQKRKDYQKEYEKSMTDEQKQKQKDYLRKYYKRYYAEKQLMMIMMIIRL